MKFQLTDEFLLEMNDLNADKAFLLFRDEEDCTFAGFAIEKKMLKHLASWLYEVHDSFLMKQNVDD